MKLQKLLELAINEKLTAEEAKQFDPLFSTDRINALGYSSYSDTIQNAYKAYRKSAIANIDVLKKFETGVKNFDDLKSFIQKHQSDPLLFALYATAAKKAQAGKLESGRGALGRGEVLIGMLSGEESGGTEGADNQIGGITYEVKASKAENFKIPLAAKRIDRFESLSKLDDLYFICKPVMKLKAWDMFLDDIKELTVGGTIEKKSTKKASMSKYLFDAGIAPSAGNINQTELNNLELFFEACYSYFQQDDADEDLFIDIDSAAGEDFLIKGKLDNPTTLDKLKPGSKLAIDVTNTSKDNVRDFQNFMQKLKQHPYVINPSAFETDMRKDMNNILKNRYIIFHETGDTKVPVPVLLDQNTGKELTVTGFTLNQVTIDFRDILK